MKTFIVLIAMLSLFGHSESYSDLVSVFGVAKLQQSHSLETHTIVIFSQRHRGAESYYGIVNINISGKSIGIKISAPFLKPISIPADSIAGCSMTCFRTNDQHVDLLIPKTGSDVMIPSSKKLLDWCWNNKRPMFPSSARRDWQYKSVPLPPSRDFRKQLESRELFDKQAKQSCLGY